MSGGSFGYLYRDELVSRRESVGEMASFLRESGYADAAEATERILCLFDVVDAAQADIADVWHAAEWCRSGDTCDDDLRASVERWRAGRAQPTLERETVPVKGLALERETIARVAPGEETTSYVSGDPTRTGEPQR